MIEAKLLQVSSISDLEISKELIKPSILNKFWLREQQSGEFVELVLCHGILK
jgi:hypothetical protein